MATSEERQEGEVPGGTGFENLEIAGGGGRVGRTVNEEDEAEASRRWREAGGRAVESGEELPSEGEEEEEPGGFGETRYGGGDHSVEEDVDHVGEGEEFWSQVDDDEELYERGSAGPGSVGQDSGPAPVGTGEGAVESGVVAGGAAGSVESGAADGVGAGDRAGVGEGGAGEDDLSGLVLDLRGEENMTLVRAVHAHLGAVGVGRALRVEGDVVQSMLQGRVRFSPELRGWLEATVQGLDARGELADLDLFRPGPAERGAVLDEELTETHRGVGTELVGRRGRVMLAPVEDAPPQEREVVTALMGGERAAPLVTVDGFQVQRERMRASMWGARTLAFATQFRLGLSPDDQYVAMSVVQQLEMCLIMYFGDSLPEPGAPWDMQRRYREVELRLGRLRWIERRVADSQRGFRGVWNWVLGSPEAVGQGVI